MALDRGRPGPLKQLFRGLSTLGKWVLGAGLFIGALLILGVYEEFSYYPEPDTISTPVYNRNLEAKTHMLGLVNEARTRVGSPPVTLGTNMQRSSTPSRAWRNAQPATGTGTA